MILLAINGINYKGFTLANVTRSMDEVAGRFLFIATSDTLEDYPIKKIAEADISISSDSLLESDSRFLSGYVDIIKPEYDIGKHAISIVGRSKTAVLVDSSVWTTKAFNGPVNIQTIARKVISELDLDIRVVNDFGIIEDFKNTVSAEPGEKAFQFLERLASKRQILLMNDAFGNLVFSRSSGVRISTILLNQKRNYENNVISGLAGYDFTKRYGSYKVVGQAAPGINIGNGIQTNSGGTSSDVDALQSKKLVLIADQEIDIATATAYAKWESNIRRANSQPYSARVQGHRHADGPWDINIKTRVYDEFAGIDSDMIIKKVVLQESEAGTFTDMVLVSPDAYSLEVQRSAFSKKMDALGNVIE